MMGRDQALALHRELEAFAAEGPGGISDQVRRRLIEIEFAFRVASADPYLREKVRTACGHLEIWLSPRKWEKQWGFERGQAVVNGNVYKVGLAIDTAFPAPGAPADLVRQ